jgi:hypothetical protein
VNAAPRERIEISGRRGDESFSLASAHFGDGSRMQNRAANELNIEVAQPDSANPRLRARGRRLREGAGRELLFDGLRVLTYASSHSFLGVEFAPFLALCAQAGGRFLAESLTQCGRARFEFVVGKTTNFLADFADLLDKGAQFSDLFLVFIEEARNST